MAGLNVRPEQYPDCTDYFEMDEWLYFQDKLKTADHAIKKLAREHGLGEVTDSRWPIRGVVNKKWSIQTTVRVALNSKYFDESSENYKREFYELHVSSCFSLWGFFYRPRTYSCIRTYGTQEINDFDLVYGDLEPLLKELAETGQIAARNL